MPTVTAKSRLLARHKRFVDEYLVDLCATKAAERCGFHSRYGSVLLARPDIQRALREAQARRIDRMEVSAARVLTELVRVAYGDIRHVFGADGRLLKPTELSDDAAAAVMSIEVVERRGGDGEIERVHKIRQADKVRALELLARHLRLLTDRVELSADVPLFALPEGARVDVGVSVQGGQAPPALPPGSDDPEKG